MGLDADFVGLHLPQVTRLLNQGLLHRLSMDACAGGPPCHAPLVEAECDHAGLQVAAMRHQRDDQGDGLRRGAKPIKHGAFRLGEALLARCADEPFVLLRVDTAVALAGLAPGRAL